VCLILLCLPLGAAEPPPVKMAPVQVMQTVLDLDLKIRWAQDSGEQWITQWVDQIHLGKVRPNSIAARAGLARGMELVAIQGQPLHGLKQEELAQVLQQAVEKEVILTVRRTPKSKEELIHLLAPN